MKEATQEDNAALEAGATTAESSAEVKKKTAFPNAPSAFCPLPHVWH